MTARFYRQQNNRIHCTLCPHNCAIREGSSGLCGVRLNSGGELNLPYYGGASALAVDPIEKKPLYHFYPGSEILSIGFVGCPLRCPFCQNYRISQSTSARTRRISPEQLVAAARDSGSIGIAYTYNEPIIHIEFVLESARLARRHGLQNVLVTSGQVNPEPAEELFCAMDGTNIDLKSFNEQFYRRELAGDLASVKEAIRIAAAHCHLEITTLVIPGKNDGSAEIEAMARFIADLRPTIPYHLSAYYPAYRYVTESTSPATIERLAAVARRHLAFVYSGNVSGANHTDCPACGRRLIERSGYHVCSAGLAGRNCIACGTPIAVVTAAAADSAGG